MSTVQVFKGTLIVLLTLIGAFILLNSLRIIIVLLIAIIIASAVRPFVTRLTRLRVPEGLAIILVYFTLLSLIVLLTVAILPPVVNQFALYIENDSRLSFRIIQAQRWFEGVISEVTQDEVSLVSPDEVRAAVSEFVGQVRRVMPSMLNDLGSTLGDFVLIFVMGAYWLTSHERATEFVTQLAPPKYRGKAEEIVNEIEDTMGSYVRGVVTVATLTGLLNFIAMQLIGVPNAVALAFIIGVTTTVPMIGGLAGGIIAVFMTLVVDPTYVPFVMLIVLVVQQLENYVLSPRIMSNSVGVDPLLIIVYTSIGFIMFGVVGALIAVPIMGTLHVLLLNLVIEPYQDSIQEFQTTDQGIPIIRSSSGEIQTVSNELKTN